MKDSSLVRAAEAVRDGRASAMVSAGNTGATMASALLRMGRIKGVSRPAIATPLPVPSKATPTVLLDAGANAECNPEWLVQFAQMGAVFATARYGIEHPKVALLSIGEEPTKGNPLVKETHKLLAEGSWIGPTGAVFVGNVEGRDLLTDAADVVVTDGFTGQRRPQDASRAALRSIGGALIETLDRHARGAGGLGAAHAGAAAGSTPGSTRRAPVGRCSSASTGSASSATARPRRSPWSTPSGWPTDMVTGDVVGHLSRAVRPPLRLSPAPNPR